MPNITSAQKLNEISDDQLNLPEKIFRDMIQSSPDAIFIYVDEEIIFINNAGIKLLRASSEEDIVGKSIGDFIPAERQKSSKNSIDYIVSNKKCCVSTEDKLLTMDGEILDIEISSSYINLNNKNGIQVFIRDITKRKQLEREIILISERIRQQVSRDLHDDLNPHLNGIEALTQVLYKKKKKNQIKEADEAEKISALINKAITKIHRLEQGLCPVDLESLGIQTPLMNLIKLVRSLYGIECKFTYDESIIIEDMTLATNLYYIAQEAIINAARHSGGSLITIILKQINNILLLSIKDNGHGISKEKKSDSDKVGGMGLKIMKYRAEIIDGVFSIQKNKPSGTIISVNIPISILKSEGRISYDGKFSKN
jgi:PAS domain S-box-containing protein